MPSIEIGPTRPVGPVQVGTAPNAHAAATAGSRTALRAGSSAPAPDAPKPSGPASGQPSALPQIERSSAFEAGAAPVDAERVAVIRKAVESGTYPIIPTRIADAMIAAGMLLRNPQT